MRRHVLLIAVSVGLTACGRPTVAHTDTRIVGLSLDELQGEVVFDVDNPWPVGLNVTRFRYDVRVQDVVVASGLQHDGMRIPARERVEVGLPVTVRWSDVRRAAGLSASAEEVAWSVDGEVGIHTPLGETVVPLGYQSTLPVLARPRVGVDAVRIGRGPTGGVGVAVDLHLTSLTGAPYGVEELGWQLALSGEAVAAGAARSRLLDRRTTALTVEVLLDPLGAASNVARLLAGYEVLAAITVAARLSTPLGVLPLDATVQHTLAWR